MFILQSEYDSAGDQQQAIDTLVKQIEDGQERCVLLGVTGSGKTFAMAKIIERMQLPTLILSHNKTLARQIWQEMSGLFPDNSVEYFVSYYDYYQPEAYIPGRDLYIDKELQMNERIEQERFSTVASLVSRPDVIAIILTIIFIDPAGLIVPLSLGDITNSNAVHANFNHTVYVSSETNDYIFHFKLLNFKIPSFIRIKIKLSLSKHL